MATQWTFGKKIGAGFAAAGFTLVALAGVGYQSTERLIDNAALVSHTHEVLRTIAELLSTLKDAETGQRGFVITGNETFLEPYLNATQQIDESFARLRTLTADNPEQQRRLDAARPLIDAKLAELRSTVEQRRGAGFDAVAKVMAAGDGKQLMDQFRGVATEMNAAEFSLLDRRGTEATSSARATEAVLLWGSLAALLLIAGIGLFISRSLSRQIGAAVQHVQSSSAELQASASQQATTAKEQATAMTEITTTIIELLATSRQIADSAQRVSRIAEQTTHAARSGDATMEKGRESIAGIRRQVDTIVSQMLELGRKAQQIGSVLDIVSELAEQTNILAVNATIEAAGAGEAGRRFAVVADEIRKLADRVAGSTKEIRGLIDDVRSSANTTVMTTETGSKAVDAGARQFQEVASSFKDIGGLVTTSSEAAKEIELSTKQQATAVEQVNVAMTSVAQTTKETEASSGQTLQTASQLAGLSRDLLRIVQPRSAA